MDAAHGHWMPWQATRSFGVRARHRGCVYVPRKVARASLTKATRRNAESSVLLPTFVSATELRVLLRLDYANTMRVLGVRSLGGKYYWKDFEGREFESTSKRKVLLPFDMVAYPLQKFGYEPELVDVEPDWPLLPRDPAAIPVVVVLGHINHGKTTLLDALCGTNVAPHEPGGITQDVRAMTGRVFGDEVELNLPGFRAKEVDGGGRQEERMTFLDTPGHEAFELSRGRTMAAADVAVVVVSVERGAELQTEEVLMHASRWKVPVVFALNKIDLPDCHLDLTRAELRRQCQLLYEHGLVDVDWTQQAEEAVPISALLKRNLEELVDRIREVASKTQLPLKRPEPLTMTPGKAVSTQNMHKRTDFLQGVHAPPNAIALILEVDKAGEEQGELVLTALVRSGRLVVGQFFVVGTAFGRITNLSLAAGVERNRKWSQCDSASVGVAVQLTGLRTRRLGGDCAVDDLLLVYPRERAWRLCEHRQRIEQLMACQVAGPPLQVAWEHDSTIEARTQAAFERETVSVPEGHSGSAYERRWQQAAVEEVSHLAEPAFHSTTRSDFSERVPLAGQLRADSRGGAEASPNPSVSRFQVLSPSEPEDQKDSSEDRSDDSSASRHGRRSARSARSARPRPVATGAWSEDPKTVKPEREFVGDRRWS